MADRLTEAFNALRAGGATFAGRVRITGWSDSSRGMLGTFRLDASADPLDNPATHPFKGAHCSPKDGHEFMLLVIPVAAGGAEDTTGPAEPVAEQGPTAGAEPAKERRPTMNANRAGMMIKEPLFWQWVSGHGAYHGPVVTGADAANTALLSICKADRKRDLDADLDAAARFDRIRRDYYAWTQEPIG